MRRLLSHTILLALAASTPVLGQSADLKAAAGSITPADVTRRINIIADDSMGGRDTPSPGLEKTAQYVADEFKRFGLKPAGENGSWFQRYTITQRRLDPGASHVGLMGNGVHVHADLSRDARFVFGSVPDEEVHGPAFLIGGPMSPDAVQGLDLKGKAVVAVIDYTKPLLPGMLQALGALIERGAAGVLIISNRDSATFAQRVASQAQLRISVDGSGGGTPVVEAHERALGAALKDAGVNLDEVRASETLVARDIPGITVGFGLKDQVLQSMTAPNTIGMIEGSDPALRQEYVVFSAHMDHVGMSPASGCQPKNGDTICNGADDDASGTVGVIELAEAFARKGVRPKRSMIFMTVSGEEKGLWGSQYFSEHPTVPLEQIVADINMDMIGRNWPDTIVAIGKEHSDLGATLERVVTRHPELRMAAIDDRWPEENFYFRSDHFNFARKGVPVLFFFNGVHPDYHQVSDSPDKIDSEKLSRIAQLVFYLGQEIGNAPERPKWNPESYDRIVEKKGVS